jgi:hypothetical protein
VKGVYDRGIVILIFILLIALVIESPIIRTSGFSANRAIRPDLEIFAAITFFSIETQVTLLWDIKKKIRYHFHLCYISNYLHQKFF